MDSKFLKRGVQSMERLRKSVLSPHPSPFSPDRRSLCSSFYLTEIKVLISPFWKMMSLFCSLAWQGASSLQICSVTGGFEEIRRWGGHIWERYELQGTG